MSSSTCIIIPCFNHGQYLDECLHSVFNQTRTDWKAIVVDDCSSDPYTISKIEAIKHPKVKVVHHTINKGLAAARNTGIRASNTPFVLPLDSDDKLHPEYLECTVGILESKPEIDCVFGWLQCFGVENIILKYQIKGIADMLVTSWIPGAGTLMRKPLWEKVNGYCEDITLRHGCEDWDFWITAVEKGCKADVIPRTLYFYRRHQESMVTRLQYVNHQTRLFIYKRHHILFDRYKKKHEFLAEGYCRSSIASLAKSKRLRAFYLALFAFMHIPSMPIVKLLLSSVCPKALKNILGRLLISNKRL